MENEILHKMASLCLTDEESSQLTKQESGNLRSLMELKNSCYGSLFSDKKNAAVNVTVTGLRNTMIKAWNCNKDDLAVRRFNDGMYQFFFKYRQDLNRVFSQSSWRLGNNPLKLHRWRFGKDVIDEEFHRTHFWIHVTGLPRQHYTKEVGLMIGGIFNGCSVVQIREKVQGGARFFRVRALVNTLEPIRKELKIRLPSQAVESFAFLKYERLPKFCYFCGRIRHRVEKCFHARESEVDDMGDYQYGDWLNANHGWSSILREINLQEVLDQQENPGAAMGEEELPDFMEE